MTLRVIIGCFCLIQAGLESLAQEMIQADTLQGVEIVGSLHSSSKVFAGQRISADGDSHQTTLINLLQENTSTYIKDGGPGILSSSSYRGGSSQHQVLLWNGMEISSPSLGLSDLNLFPASLFDQMELNSGAGALIKGNGVFGLALDMLTIEPDSETKVSVDIIANPVLSQLGNSIILRERLGVIQTDIKLFRVTAENAFPYNDDSGPRVERQIRRHAAMENWGASATLIYPMKKSGDWNLSIQRTGLEREVPKLIGATPRGETLEDDNLRAMLLGHHDIASWNMEYAVGYSKEQQQYIDSLSDLHSRIEAELWHLRWVASKNLRPMGTIRFKISLDQNEVHTENYSSVQGRQSVGLYGEWEKNIGNLAMNLSARQAWVDQKTIPLTSSFGLRYKNGKWVGHSSIAKMYRLPSLNDLYWNPGGNQDLVPEEGWMWDAGFIFSEEAMEISATYFWNKYQDMIVWQPTNMGFWSPVNRSLLSSQGIELAITGNLKSNLKAKGLLTLLDLVDWRQNINDVENSERKPMYYPMITARAFLSYRKDSHEWTWTQFVNGKVYADSSNLTEVPASFPMNINYTYHLHKEESNMQVGLGVLNVLNESYAFILGRPLPGRTVQFTLTYHIKT